MSIRKPLRIMRPIDAVFEKTICGLTFAGSPGKSKFIFHIRTVDYDFCGLRLYLPEVIGGSGSELPVILKEVSSTYTSGICVM